MELSIGIAVIAGLISFISPCVLPLVPAYIGYMGGRVTNTVSSQVAVTAGGGGQKITTGPSLSVRFNTLLHGIFFVAGFTVVFVTIGLLSTAFIQEIGGGENLNLITDIIGRVGGVIIIFFGLHFMGVMPSVFARIREKQGALDNPLTTVVIALLVTAILLWAFVKTVIAAPVIAVFVLWLVLGGGFTKPGIFWNKVITTLQNALYTDTRKQMTASGRQGFSGSAIMGVVFSAGWTPCIGPVFGAVLTMAANGGNVGQAAGMLTGYSLGLGIPFLMTAVLLDGAQNTLRKLQKQMRKIELASGAFLILIGVLVAGGTLQNLSQQFAGDFAEFSITIEERALEFFGVEDGLSGAASSETRTEGALVIAGSGSDDAGTGESDTVEGEGAGPNSISGAAEQAPPAVGLSIGNLAPDFETVTDTGEPVRLSDLRGNVVLLNFWATWCGPCRIEMPEFQEIFEQRHADGFTVLAVDNQETVEDVQGFRDEFGLTFPLGMDERGEIQEQYGIFSYPSTFILNEDGVIVARNFGPLTVARINEMVDDALS